MRRRPGYKRSVASRPVFFVWVCQGRVCRANGSDALVQMASHAVGQRPADDERVLLLRGGCYGLCDLGPNVVVRRYGPGEPLPSIDEDRLSLLEDDHETIYCGVTTADVDVVLGAHLDDDAPVVRLTRATKEATIPAASPVAAKIRALRAKRKAGNFDDDA